MSHGARLARYSEVSTTLALLSDRRLGRLVDGARGVGSGIGGASAVLDVAGVPVFVKRVPLTDLERRPENVMSTANMFGLVSWRARAKRGTAMSERSERIGQLSADKVSWRVRAKRGTAMSERSEEQT